VPESRDAQIMINLEVSIMALVKKVMRENNISASSYARKLILHDLAGRGILTQEIMLQVMTTDSVEELQAQILEKVGAAGHANS
jgi:hypothetical protein